MTEETQPFNNNTSSRRTDGTRPLGSIQEEPHKLRPKIGLLSGICLIVGSVIGSGIFITPHDVMRDAGSIGMSLVIWISCGVFSFIGAYCYAELGSMGMIRSGGDYIYVYEAFGPFLAFIRLWVECLIVRPGSQAIVALTFAEYILKPFYPDCNPPQAPLIILAVVCILLVTFINCWDVKWATTTQNFFTGAKLLGLIAIIVTGLVHMAQGEIKNFEKPFEATTSDHGRIALAFCYALFAYSGWNYLNFVTEELHLPIRNLPRCILFSITLCTVVYILTNVAFMAVLSPEVMMEAPAVVVLFGEIAYGRIYWIVFVIVALSTIGSVNGILFTSARLIQSGAYEGQLLEPLRMIQAHRETPIPGVIIACLLSLMYLGACSIRGLIISISITNWLAIGVTISVLLYLRWKKPEMIRPVKVPIILPILYLLFTCFLVIVPLYSSPKEAWLGISLMLIAIPLYYIFVWWRKKPVILHKISGNLGKVIQKALLVY